MEIVYSIFIGIIASIIVGMIAGMIVGIGLQCRRDMHVWWLTIVSSFKPRRCLTENSAAAAGPSTSAIFAASSAMMGP